MPIATVRSYYFLCAMLAQETRCCCLILATAMEAPDRNNDIDD